MKRPLVALAALSLTLAISVGTGAASAAGPSLTVQSLTPVHTVKVAKSFTARIAQSDPTLLKAKGTKLTNVMVRLDYDPVASYYGGVQGLAATAPETTGTSLRQNAAAVDAYQRYLSAYDARVIRDIRAEVPGITIRRAFHIVFGGLSVQLPANRAKDLMKVNGVVAVMRNRLVHPQTNVTPTFLGATKVWQRLGGPILAGDDVVVGELDTGIWPEHPSFEDHGLPAPPGGPYACEFGDGSDPALGDPFTCNNKLVGAYAFVDTYLSVLGAKDGEFCDVAAGVCSARDSNGHGTHTSSTAAGDVTEGAEIFGVPKGTVSGMAPGARLIMYRVCLDEGCFTDDMVAAIGQSVLDGVDVLNISIGPFGPPYSDAVPLALLDAYASGVLANVSAGNDGPTAGTSSDPGPWAVTVGASTSPRFYQTTLHVTADGGGTFDVQGSTVTAGVDTPTDIVLARDLSGYEDPFCLTPLPSSVAGQIVACERGVNARVTKSYNVSVGGAVGMILYNTVLNQGTNTDNHWVPTVHIDGQQGLDFLDFMDAHTGEQATWGPGLPTETRPDVMTSFSSRGPATDWIVPDITAPGIQVLAGHTPEPLFDSADGEGVAGPPGELYQAIAGTSMAAPHSTGISALIKAMHPDWTPGQIKSALMTSAVEDVLKEDGTTPADPFDDGAGAIRARGARATLTMDVDAADYYAAAGNADEYPNLNTPSINVDPLSGQVFVPRTFTNSGDETVTYKVKGTTDDPAVSIVAFPGHFTLDPGQSAKVQLRFTVGPGAALGQHFGRIGLTPTSETGLKAHLPVAFVVGPGSVDVTESCESTSIVVGESTPCQTTVTNNSSDEANVHAELAPLNTSIVKIDNVVGGNQVGNKSWTFDGTLSPALAPTVDAIAPGGSPYGYLSLASLGVQGFNLGDEELAQFDVSDYQFGGESYNVISLVSDGYAIMGDDTTIDFQPQTFPDPVVPNNVLAPFWTDMNPGATDGGLLYAAEVSDNIDNWIVLEWEGVPVFSTGEKQTFQIWVQTDAEFQSFEYATITGSGDPAGLNTGAENRDGSSGVNLGSIPASGDAYHIETSPPEAGGTATITYDAIGQSPGTTRLKSTMTSDVTTGTSFAYVVMSVG